MRPAPSTRRRSLPWPLSAAAAGPAPSPRCPCSRLRRFECRVRQAAATSPPISLTCGLSTLRSSTTGRPAKKPGEFSIQRSRPCSHSSTGASGTSAKATNERARKRMGLFCIGERLSSGGWVGTNRFAGVGHGERNVNRNSPPQAGSALRQCAPRCRPATICQAGSNQLLEKARRVGNPVLAGDPQPSAEPFGNDACSVHATGKAIDAKTRQQ